MKLSTILTVYNRNELALVHIRESMNCSRVPDEIIVVNDGGKDFKEDVEKMEKTCPVVYAQIKEDIVWNYNGACNLGAWLSSGDYLAYEDNDNIPSYTWYEEALEVFENNSDAGRVQARKRRVISIEDMLTKPKEEWQSDYTMGANMGTAMFPRDIYLKLKGHDERFCGRYGWMYYDWRQRLLNRAQVEFYSVGEYWFTLDGQSDLQRSNSGENLRYKRDNDRTKRMQGPIGILNFTYEFSVFPRNQE